MVATIHQRDRNTLASPEMLLWVGRRIWDNLPLLLFIDLVLAVSALPALLLALTGPWVLALPVAAVICGPVWAGTVATADRIHHDDAASAWLFLGMTRSHAVAGAAVSLVPALIAAALLGTISIWAANPEARWLVIPLLLDCSLSIIAAVCCVSVFSLVTTGRLRGRALWRASLAIGVANLVPVVGSLTFLAMLGWFLIQLAPMVFPIILAPIAILFSALTWSTVENVMRMMSEH